jgi:hypothetical protein
LTAKDAKSATQAMKAELQFFFAIFGAVALTCFG